MALAGPPAGQAAVTALAVPPRFPSLVAGGGYESYYMRAVDPVTGCAVWLRHTFQMGGGGAAPVGSIWLTLFGAGGGVVATKYSTAEVEALAEPSAGWVRIGESLFGPEGVRGAIDGASWELDFEDGGEPPLRHLPARFLYRAPLPKTKPESPLPGARISGRVELNDTLFELDRRPGMVGHNWGTQHAERWIWLHGTGFAEREDAWLDLAVGRVRVAGRVLPWIANGVLSVGGRRIRLGGLRPGALLRVEEEPLTLSLEAGGTGGELVSLRASSPREQTVVWRYADPDGSEHHVANCSASALDLELRDRDGTRTRLTTQFGGAYELGMRETDHGLPVQPFADS